MTPIQVYSAEWGDSCLTSIKLKRLWDHPMQSYSSSCVQNLKKAQISMWGKFLPHISATTSSVPVKQSIQAPVMGHVQLLLKLPDPTITPWHSIPFPPLRSPPNSPEGGNFTPYLHYHHSYQGQTKHANVDK